MNPKGTSDASIIGSDNHDNAATVRGVRQTGVVVLIDCGTYSRQSEFLIKIEDTLKLKI